MFINKKNYMAYLYKRLVKQISVDGGLSWVTQQPLEYQVGALIDAASDCIPQNLERWVDVEYASGDSNTYICEGYDLYSVRKLQISYDGGVSWQDAVPYETEKNALIESNSTVCGYIPPIYRWVKVVVDYDNPNTYECYNEDEENPTYSLYSIEVQQVSYNNGLSWENVEPIIKRRDEKIKDWSLECGYVPLERWEKVPFDSANTETYICGGEDGYHLYSKEKLQLSYDNGSSWVDSEPLETREGELLDDRAILCGAIPWKSGFEGTTEFSNFVFYPIIITEEGNVNLTISSDDETEFHMLYSGAPVINLSHFWENSRADADLKTLVNFIDTSNVTDMSYMFYNCQRLEYVNASIFDTDNVTDMSYMFSYCRDIQNLDLSSWNVSKVENMSHMFSQSNHIVQLDLSNWDTSNVTDMSYMFEDCEILPSIDLSHFNTSNVTDMSYMFGKCWRMQNLDLSTWNVGKVENMSNLFRDCFDIVQLDLSGWNTSNATDMNRMFYRCETLPSIDVSSFVTSNVKNMKEMFYGCESLTELNLSNFNTSNVTDMSQMFYGCTSLTSLDLTSFDTSKVTTIDSMFTNCSNLESLDLSNFDASNLKSMRGVFYGCSSLTELNLGNFDISNVTYIDNVFNNCNKLSSITCTQAAKDKLMRLSDTEFPTRNTVEWHIV